MSLLTCVGDLRKYMGIHPKSSYRFVQADIAGRETIMSLFEQDYFEYVAHFAVDSHVIRSIKDLAKFLRTNVMGTQILIDTAEKIGIIECVHVTREEVYGELDFDPIVF